MKWKDENMRVRLMQEAYIDDAIQLESEKESPLR